MIHTEADQAAAEQPVPPVLPPPVLPPEEPVEPLIMLRMLSHLLLGKL